MCEHIEDQHFIYRWFTKAEINFKKNKISAFSLVDPEQKLSVNWCKHSVLDCFSNCDCCPNEKECCDFSLKNPMPYIRKERLLKQFNNIPETKWEEFFDLKRGARYKIRDNSESLIVKDGSLSQDDKRMIVSLIKKAKEFVVGNINVGDLRSDRVQVYHCPSRNNYAHSIINQSYADKTDLDIARIISRKLKIFM